ncbi:MAG: hypothetical protein U1E61_15780 [Bradyrhizobium sp.]
MIFGFTILNDWSARDIQQWGICCRARPVPSQGLRHVRSADGADHVARRRLGFACEPKQEPNRAYLKQAKPAIST